MSRDVVAFISYARQDGEKYAKALRERLKNEEPEITLWRDREEMRGGADFEEQIKRAIDSVRHMILIMTPASMRSEWVRREWRYAREQGVCVCPVKGASEDELREPRAQMPRWMSQAQTYDLDKEWESFVLFVKSPCQATRVPFMAPGLPAAFVRRPDEFDQIIGQVLDAKRENPGGKTLVVQGFGGFGKTTLASSVCHDGDVVTACDGGVLWATLGGEPALLDELKKLYAALTGERPAFVDASDASIELGKKLQGKRCLLVIDDVWDDEHVAPFLRGADSSARLITTRSARIASKVAGAPARIAVGEMRPQEAIQVLVSRLPILPTDLKPFRSLAGRLGQYPLLLELANGALLEPMAAGETLNGAVEWINQQLDELGVVAFDRDDTTARNQAVARTIEMSLRLLKDKRDRCLELGIFSDDAEVPLSVLALVWNTSDFDTRRLAERLNELSLVKLSPSSRTIRLHDSVRAYLVTQLRDAAGLQGKLADAWKDPARVTSPYALHYALWHVAEAMVDPHQVPQRARQLLGVLTDPRLRLHYVEHEDHVGLNRVLERALRRAAACGDASIPALVAAMATVNLSLSVELAPERIVDCARSGDLARAVGRLEMFAPEPEWRTAAKLLVSWLGAVPKPDEARTLAEDTAPECDRPELVSLLKWARLAPDGVPPQTSAPQGGPGIDTVSAILARAGGIEGAAEGIEPLNLSLLASGIDAQASGFIAVSDGPPLVAFARLAPAVHTPYLQRYIAIHAANRYRYYRNRSLWALLKPVLEVPDAAWVRSIVEELVLSALKVTRVDFRDCLPLAVRALEARAGRAEAAERIDQYRDRLRAEVATLVPTRGKADSWAHNQRRAAALAEVYAVALGRIDDASAMLQLARDLPKGFAGFRVYSALTLAEATRIARPAHREGIDAALLSAQAASHRIQDHPFCVQATASVNALRARWWPQADLDLDKILESFLDKPTGPAFCIVHRVGETFQFRAHDAHTLPIPIAVSAANTLRQIAAAHGRDPHVVREANVDDAWGLDDPVPAGTEVNVPDEDFVPILAARLAAEALLARRPDVIQRLVPLAVSNPTALDTMLGRLLLSALDRPLQVPDLLSNLDVAPFADHATTSEARFA